MKKTLKKKSILNIVAFTGCSFLVAGCNKTLKEPTFSNDLFFKIGGWVEPSHDLLNEEQFSNLEQSGINTIYSLYAANNLNDTLLGLELSEKHNIKYYVNEHNLFSPYLKNEMDVSKADFLNNENFKKYDKYSSFAGYMLKDEPKVDEFDSLSKVKKEFEKQTNKDCYINLLPTYGNTGTAYQYYIEDYLNKFSPNYLSYDHYALLNKYGNEVITNDVIRNLDIVSHLCKEKGVDMNTFVSVGNFNDDYGLLIRPTSSIRDIYWQVNSQLAYGSKGIQYFCYMTPNSVSENEFQHNMIDYDGTRTERYYFVKEVNTYLKSIQSAFLDFSFKGTYLQNGYKNIEDIDFYTNPAFGKDYKNVEHRLTSMENVKNYSSSRDSLCGLFSNKDGYQGFYISNFEDPNKNLKNDINITFNKYSKVKIYSSSGVSILNLVNSTFNYTINSGEGVFVIPYE